MPLPNEKYQLAMEMKWQGRSYKEIAEACGTTEGNVQQWFNTDGVLYDLYVAYANKKGRELEQQSSDIFKRNIGLASQLIENAFRKEVARIAKLEKDGQAVNYDYAIELAEKLLNRAGVVIVKKLETKTDERGADTYTSLLEELASLGIDANTGLRKKALEVGTN